MAIVDTFDGKLIAIEELNGYLSITVTTPVIVAANVILTMSQAYELEAAISNVIDRIEGQKGISKCLRPFKA